MGRWRLLVSRQPAPSLSARRTPPLRLATGKAATRSMERLTILGTLAGPPGGSSGGAAAALAAGYVSLEIGSDIAGSIRVPAAFCGVFGHRPSCGVVSLGGFMPPTAEVRLSADSELPVLGPLARTAADLALALEVLAGPDDPEAIAYRLTLPPARHNTLKDSNEQVVWPAAATLPGLPATAIPIDRSEAGLPIGVQVIGPYLEDRTTIAFAELIEREFGGFVPPPGL